MSELPVICHECGNDEGPYDGLCLDCLEASEVTARVHLHPRDDVVEHELNGLQCVCGPALKRVHDANVSALVIQHHALVPAKEG